MQILSNRTSPSIEAGATQGSSRADDQAVEPRADATRITRWWRVVVASLRAARRAPARWSRWAPVRSSRPPVIASSRRRVRALLVNLQGWSEEVTFGVALKVIFSGGRRS
jgi:hypothetical protein